jgi:hypothetical protein
MKPPNEQARRRFPRQKMRGIRLKLADGQRWHFQAPKAELTLTRVENQLCPDIRYVFGTAGEEFRQLVERCAVRESAEQDSTLAKTLWLAGVSLRIQYDLSSVETSKLLWPLIERWCHDDDPLRLLHRSLLTDPMREGIAILDQVLAAARQANAEALKVG